MGPPNIPVYLDRILWYSRPVIWSIVNIRPVCPPANLPVMVILPLIGMQIESRVELAPFPLRNSFRGKHNAAFRKMRGIEATVGGLSLFPVKNFKAKPTLVRA